MPRVSCTLVTRRSWRCPRAHREDVSVYISYTSIKTALQAIPYRSGARERVSQPPTLLQPATMHFCPKRILLLALIPSALAQSISAFLQSTIFDTNNGFSIFPLLEDVGSPDLFPMPPCGSFQLEESTIEQMQAAMSNGTLTSVQLCLCYLQRTLQTNSYIRYVWHQQES